MLRLLPMTALRKLHCGVGPPDQRRQRAVPVQAGKVCNHRASPNRHLSSIPRNGYGPANMQCAARATARRDPLIDGKLEHQLMTAFEKIHRSFPSAVQGPQWAVHVAQHDPRRQSSLSSAEGGCEPLVPCRKSHENLIINDL